ncbi:MAG: putative signal transducing protein [Vicingaceae bacterium]
MSNWVVVYKSNNSNNAHIVKSVLEDNDIDVVLIDKMDSMHTHLMNAEIELHVNPENAVKAKHIISKNEL